MVILSYYDSIPVPYGGLSTLYHSRWCQKIFLVHLGDGEGWSSLTKTFLGKFANIWLPILSWYEPQCLMVIGRDGGFNTMS